jgi:tetratricopeptide (TPR) repeat protein
MIIGRLASAPRRRIATEIMRRGGALTFRLNKADRLVVGYGAHARLPTLYTVLERAERCGIGCLSEQRLLNALGLSESPPSSPRTVRLHDLIHLSGLDRSAIKLLSLFDIINDQNGAFEFRDLVAARQVRRLRDGGTSLGDIIAALVTTRRWSFDGNRLAHLRLTRLADGELARTVGDYLADMDGQMRLPLGDGGNPSLDELFAAAAAAERAELWRAAETTYRRIIGIAPRNSVAHFNLANVLGAQKRGAEAEASLRRAISLDPSFAEAWYNLAHLLDSRGDALAARRCLERAIEVDERCADAIYNLARLWMIAGEPMRATPLYERYLALDTSSPWAVRARQLLRLCRMVQRDISDQ